ncbi:amidohydrolase family protein [Haloactinomyces albus]|uniref:Cytosine/adenosine deaminase-related metal-dependent hydrolase n=1 Tax=Haloactinomyces albus TaxID=1352928 RepID=A0AAE3ZJN4_9ACTN|nr:amidohydrolase family protein [Haloactinomyces albus]MDR7304109.1 cytosine/adenosine deaminase-related metal-dependent hydrolase [Haloactinomyces albus]
MTPSPKSETMQHLFAHDELLLLPEALLLPEGPAHEYAVVIADGIFQHVGPAREVLAARSDLEPVRLPGHILMPGFIDAHHHLTQSFGKAAGFGEPSEIFRRIWIPLEHSLDEETAYVAAKLAALEALRGGFTTVTEAGTRAPVDVATVAAATQDTGIRCVLGMVCHEEPDHGEQHLARWDDATLIHPSLAIPIPEIATAETLRDTARLCADAGTVFQIHVNEHLAAVERSLERHGRRPLEHLHDIGALGPHTLAAHTTLLTPPEMRLLADSGAAISYNPVASAWKGNAVAPAHMLATLGVRFGLGTDGTRGDGFRLADAAEFAQRLAYGLDTGDSSCGGGWSWLEHATAGSAAAVGLQELTGEIATGKAADFLLVDTNVPELQPSRDLPWELVRLANRDQITAVVIGGQLRLWKGWPPDWDGPAFVEHAADIGGKVLEQAPLQRVHSTSVEHRRTSNGRGCDR